MNRFPELEPWLRRGFGRGYCYGVIADIDAQMRAILKQAGDVPTEPCRPAPGELFCTVDLDEIVIGAGHEKHSKVWHAARILQAIGYLSVFQTRHYAGKGKWDIEIADSAVELGVRIGLFELVVGYGGDIESGARTRTGLSKARKQSARARKAEAESRNAVYLADAVRRWEANPRQSVNAIAESIAKATPNGRVGTIRKVIAKARPRPGL